MGEFVERAGHGGDGDSPVAEVDIVAADWAHGIGLYWYRQGDGMKFTKYQFMGDASTEAVERRWQAARARLMRILA